MQLVVENERLDGEPTTVIRGPENGGLSTRFVGRVPGADFITLDYSSTKLRSLVIRLQSILPVTVIMFDAADVEVQRLTLTVGDAVIPLPKNSSKVAIANADPFPAAVRVYIL